MILRSLQAEKTSQGSKSEPASAVFLETQKQVQVPYAIVLQSEHSRLAGDLTAALSEDIFGDLNPQVIQASAEHDFGWDESDEKQLQAIGEHSPQPFPELSVEETLDSWRKSISRAASVTPLVEVLISRHLTMLGLSDPKRQDFVRSETERRREMERVLPYQPADLDRWTAVMGFCDLLSLYLCSGSQQAVDLPFAHPADPDCEGESVTTLFWQDGNPRFSAAVLRPGTRLSLAVRRYSGSGTDLEPMSLEWFFPAG